MQATAVSPYYAMNQTAPDFFKQNDNGNTITLNPKSFGLNFNQTED